MRRCLPGDLLAAAALVAAAMPDQRLGLIRQILDQADAAHRYTKRFGRPHPIWGNGSLMARARAFSAGAANHGSEAFLSSLAALAAELAARKRKATSCRLGSGRAAPHMLI